MTAHCSWIIRRNNRKGSRWPSFLLTSFLCLLIVSAQGQAVFKEANTFDYGTIVAGIGFRLINKAGK